MLTKTIGLQRRLKPGKLRETYSIRRPGKSRLDFGNTVFRDNNKIRIRKPIAEAGARQCFVERLFNRVRPGNFPGGRLPGPFRRKRNLDTGGFGQLQQRAVGRLSFDVELDFLCDRSGLGPGGQRSKYKKFTKEPRLHFIVVHYVPQRMTLSAGRRKKTRRYWVERKRTPRPQRSAFNPLQRSGNGRRDPQS